MNYCKHDILFYLGKSKTIYKDSIQYKNEYVCAYCGSKNIFNGSKIKTSIDLSHYNINLKDNKKIYKTINELKPILKEYMELQNSKNNTKILVLNK